MSAKGRGIQSVEVGGRLLAALVDASRPLMLRDLAAAAELAPAQAHAYLASYRKLGLVEQDGATGHYRLGPFAMRLALARMRSHEPLAAAGRAAAELGTRFGLMVAVVVWGPHAPTVVYLQDSPQTLTVNVRQGTVFAVTPTASGRVFGAFQGEEEAVARRVEQELSDTLHHHGTQKALSRAEYEAAIEEVRRHGCAFASGVSVPGVNAASAPVFDADGRLAYAMTLIGQQAELPLASGSAPVRALLEETSRLSAANRGRDERPGSTRRAAAAG